VGTQDLSQCPLEGASEREADATPCGRSSGLRTLQSGLYVWLFANRQDGSARAERSPWQTPDPDNRCCRLPRVDYARGPANSQNRAQLSYGVWFCGSRKSGPGRAEQHTLVHAGSRQQLLPASPCALHAESREQPERSEPWHSAGRLCAASCQKSAHQHRMPSLYTDAGLVPR